MTTTYPTPPEWWTDAESLVAASDPSFAHRPPQAEAARLIAEAFRSRTHTAIDAPVGLGKSMAALTAAENATGRTVISTATKALQNQMRDTDIPFLQAVGVLTREVVVLEGRNNFACLNRAVHELDRANPAAKKTIKAVIKHLRKAPEAARRDQIPVAIPDWLWSRLSSDSDVCGVLMCKNTSTCAYEKIRNHARSADIVIVNHHVLLADASIKGGDAASWGLRPVEEGDRVRMGVLGAFKNLIVDEAHALESACESFGEQRVTIRGIQALATRVSKHEHSGEATRRLAACLDEMQIGMLGLPQGCLIMATHDEKAIFEQAAEEAKAAAESLRAHSSSFESNVAAEILVAACRSLSKKLTAIDTAIRTGSDEFGPRAPSADATGICSQLVDASGWLNRNLFAMVTTVAMSGTLAVPGNRDWVTHRIGLDAKVEMLPTVFNLTDQRLVYVTPRVEAKGAESMARSTDADVAEIKDLVSASGGRALVLFPAMTDLRFVHDRLRIDHTLLAQGITIDPSVESFTGDPVPASNAALAQWFKEDTSSVLLATRSFMEGVDFPGETASIVVIVRFPNLRPDDPLTLARRQHIERRGGNAWRDYQEPAMQLVFRQAAGRAIRRVTDKGVVAVLDPRCKTKGYAKTALRSLAPSDYTHSMDDVRTFLA
jgi:ATP-dependent DNA helicase DinG